jgi:alkylation response protein AidB-like acyl-CoA dehydrogenase
MDWLPRTVLFSSQIPDPIFRELDEIGRITDDFINDFLKPHLQKSERLLEADPRFLDRVLLSELNRRGFFSMWVPKILGGQGYHSLTLNIFCEKLGAVCLGTANIVGAHYFALGLLSLSHSYKILRRLTHLIRQGEKSGQAFVVSAAVTEPSAGTDREDMDLLKKSKVSSWAKQTAAGYELNGSKIFISNAIWAGCHVVVSTTTPERPADGMVILVASAALDGLEVSIPEQKMGQHCCPASSIFFRNCLVTTDNVALNEHQFSNREEFLQFTHQLTEDVLTMSRAGVGMLATGAAYVGLETVQNEIKSNPVFQKLAHYEWVQSSLAEMVLNFLLARDLSWEASLQNHFCGPFQGLMKPMNYYLFKFLPTPLLTAFGKFLEKPSVMTDQRKLRKSLVTKQNERLSLGLSSAAKWSASDLAMKNCQIALDLLGAKTFHNSSVDIFKIIRDCKLLQIYEGTNQFNRLHVFKSFQECQTVPMFEEPFPEATL